MVIAISGLHCQKAPRVFPLSPQPRASPSAKLQNAVILGKVFQKYLTVGLWVWAVGCGPALRDIPTLPSTITSVVEMERLMATFTTTSAHQGIKHA